MSDAAAPVPPPAMPAEAHMTDDRADDRLVAATLLDLARASAGTGGFRPSEAARRLAPADWRRMMPTVRRVAARLQRDGLISVTQRGRAVDALAARGHFRMSRPLH